MKRDIDWREACCGRAAGADVLIGDVDRVAEPLPPPNAADFADAGRRAGEALRLFLRRRGLLRLLMAHRLGVSADAVVLGYDARGAPVLRTAPSPAATRVFVSVSARGRLAAFALAPMPVGIDLEPLQHPGSIEAALTGTERAALAVAPLPDRTVMVLRYWTAKEAYLKALGMGLLRDPALVDIAPGPAESFGVLDAGRAAPGEGRWLRAEFRGCPIVVAVYAARSVRGRGGESGAGAAGGNLVS